MPTKRKVVRKETPTTFNPKKLPDIRPTYTMLLTIGNDTYTASSDDVTEAILGLKPAKISSKTVFTLEHNGERSQVMKSVAKTKMTLANRLAATLLGRYLVMRLKP